ncbi:hypothetical protein CR513_56978, partial [Mucuna pruriens]
MGNSLNNNGLLSNVGEGDGSGHVQLGRRIIVTLPRRQIDLQQVGVFNEKWSMLHVVDASSCVLELLRRLGDGKGLILKLQGMDTGDGKHPALAYDFVFNIQAITETGVQVWPYYSVTNTTLVIKQSKDNVMETEVYLYGIEHKGGLIVVQKKKTKGVDLPYALTVAHYYATSAGINDIYNTKTNFGLSVVAKIRASNGNLDMKVEGPEQHPASALFYMFDEVNKTGKWEPTMCPHCLNVRRQRSQQSDSEDSDSVPAAQPRGSRQNSSISNDGSGSLEFPCRLQLGTSSTVDLINGMSEKREDGAFFERWRVLYSVDGSTCDVRLSRLVYKDGNVPSVFFLLLDSKYLNCDWLRLQIYRTETDFLKTFYMQSHGSITWTKTNRTVDARGAVTDIKVFLYGSGNRGCLLVEESKRNSRNDEEANAVTVAHYFANRSSDSDMGFSVVAKIRASNANFYVRVEGPEQHPSSALFYMFEQVNRTGIWKPTMCPHCDNIRRGRMFWMSDGEDSDSVPILSRRRDGRQDATSIANHGRFNGHGNGNFIDTNYM